MRSPSTSIGLSERSLKTDQLPVVGLNYGFGGQMKVEEITSGVPYGATTITRPDAQRQPSGNELGGARYKGRAIAETAAKLHG